MRIPALFLICGGLALSNAALAQDTSGTGTDTGTSEVTVIGSFDQLSPGNQKIAESLFGGQTISGDGTAEALTLDQIAVMKNGQGWGQVFKEMKASGLTEAKNLGQLVSGHSKTLKADRLEGSIADTENTAEVYPDGNSDTGAGDVGVTDGTPEPEVAPETGAFDELSPGNRKIVESLFEGQTISGDGTGEAMTLDQIAAAKQDGQGWGRVFKQMKSDGLIEAKNLGQLVSDKSKSSSATYSARGTRSEIVLTTAGGRTMSFGKSNRSSGRKASLNRSGARTGHKGGRKFSGRVSGGFKNQSASISKGGSGGSSGSFRGKSGKTK